MAINNFSKLKVLPDNSSDNWVSPYDIIWNLRYLRGYFDAQEQDEVSTTLWWAEQFIIECYKAEKGND